jgi:hypothetical protein
LREEFENEKKKEQNFFELPERGIEPQNFIRTATSLKKGCSEDTHKFT